MPEGGLGIAIHGGGGEWQSVSGGELVGSSSSSWGSDTPLDSWLYFTLTMAYAGSNTYNLQIRINSADSSGNIGPLFSEKSVSLSNPDLAAAETIYPYFSVDGGRYSTFDNFAASNEAAPVPEPGTWAAAAMLAGGAGLMRWRKRVKIS